MASSSTDDGGQPRLAFADIGPGEDIWEYQVVATSLVEELASFGQLYRDRADGENIFDELKNQWGWGGFVTHDLARCRLAARLVALFYDWWNIFVRLAEPDWHREAITSRPLLLHAIAERVRHARQTTIKIASTHARAVPAAAALRAVAAFLRGLVKNAEQLTRPPTMARNPVQSLPGLPQGPPVALSSAPETGVTQLRIENGSDREPVSTTTAVFRLNRNQRKALQEIVKSLTCLREF